MNLKSKILVSSAAVALTMTGVSGAQAAEPQQAPRMVIETVNLSERLENATPLTVPAGGETSLAYIEIPPTIPKPVVEVASPEPEAVVPPVATQQAVDPAPQVQLEASSASVIPAAVPVIVETPPSPVEPVVTSGVGAALVASAYGQLGVAQDCTAMVENALRSVGKSVGDLAPAQFFGFGTVVGSPEPGDLVITSGHVAIYVGNGEVISGGFDGMNTVKHPLSYLAGASFVRVS